MDFSCTYEGETSVSSTIEIDNTASVVTSFDINDVQQTPVPLGFNLEFYTGSDYASVADLRFKCLLSYLINLQFKR